MVKFDLCSSCFLKKNVENGIVAQSDGAPNSNRKIDGSRPTLSISRCCVLAKYTLLLTFQFSRRCGSVNKSAS